MRLVTRKLHRAFPELDKFDDAVCESYIEQAVDKGRHWLLVLNVVVAILLGIVLWAGCMALVAWAFDDFDHEQYNWLKKVAHVVTVSGALWIPYIAGCVSRDLWMHRRIRILLATAKCRECNYSLLGLRIQNNHESASVNCPECGLETVLKDMGLTQADIDPNYQPATP